ncbi:MAG: CDP-glycerol glycerophosphotransferase family protein [Gammaproteobacteria bacterium]
MKILSNCKYFTQYRKFLKLPEEKRALVFYSEGRDYWTYLEPIIRYLLNNNKQALAYVTSDPSDPGLSIQDPNYHGFVIGSGTIRTIFFASLKTKLLVMTMPDLNTFHIKRSPQTQHVAYIHHAIVSCHRAYRKGAFDHFDSIFCVGPHHKDEIRKIEQHYQLRQKQLIEHGYARLDTILAEKNQHSQPKDGPIHVLLAPTWGTHAILETIGSEVINILLSAQFKIIIRPHPQTRKLKTELWTQIKNQYAHHPNITLDENISSQASLLQSHLMISDWSGAALDYAFGLEKPVLFIDVPPKINNPEHSQLSLPVLEETLRSQIGQVIASDQLAQIPQAIRALTANSASFHEKIITARKQWIFNIGKSGKMGALALLDILKMSKAKA